MVQVCALLESVALWHSTGGGGLGWAQSTIISQFSHTNTRSAYPVTSALLSFSVFSDYATVRLLLNHATQVRKISKIVQFLLPALLPDQKCAELSFHFMNFFFRLKPSLHNSKTCHNSHKYGLNIG